MVIEIVLVGGDGVVVGRVDGPVAGIDGLGRPADHVAAARPPVAVARLQGPRVLDLRVAGDELAGLGVGKHDVALRTGVVDVFDRALPGEVAPAVAAADVGERRLVDRLALELDLAQGDRQGGLGIEARGGRQPLALDELAVDREHRAVGAGVEDHARAGHGQAVDLLREAQVDSAARVGVDLAGHHLFLARRPELARQQGLQDALGRAAQGGVAGLAEAFEGAEVALDEAGGAVGAPLQDLSTLRGGREQRRGKQQYHYCGKSALFGHLKFPQPPTGFKPMRGKPRGFGPEFYPVAFAPVADKARHPGASRRGIAAAATGGHTKPPSSPAGDSSQVPDCGKKSPCATPPRSRIRKTAGHPRPGQPADRPERSCRRGGRGLQLLRTRPRFCSPSSRP